MRAFHYFFWIWTKPDASQLAVARNANDSRLLLGRCYGNERTTTVVLKCCIQGDCSVSVKKWHSGQRGGRGGWGFAARSPVFFFSSPPPPLSAIIWSDRKREKFLKQLERTAREWWKLFPRSPVFFPQLLWAWHRTGGPLLWALVLSRSFSLLLAVLGDPKAGGGGGVSEGVLCPPV